MSNNLVNYTNNWNVLSNSVAQLLKILEESSDSNVKLIIIQKLFFFKKIGTKFIQRNISELLNILEKENYEVKSQLLEIILDVLEEHDVPKFLSIVQKQLETLNHEEKLSSAQELFQNQVLDSIVFLIDQKMKLDSNSVLEITRTIILHKHSAKEIVNKIRNLIWTLSSHKERFPQLQHKLQQNLIHIPNPDIFQNVFTHVCEEIDGASAFPLLCKMAGFVESFKNSSNKQQNQEETYQDQKFTTKTIVKEDGTYGTETVLVEPQLVTSSDDVFRRISETMLKDTVFVVNFFRNLLILISKSDETNADYNKQVSYILYGIFLIYKYYQSHKESDKTLFKELNLIVKRIVQKDFKSLTVTKVKGQKNQEEKKEELQNLSEFDDQIYFR